MILPANPALRGYYRCEKCDVSGAGDRCWCCSSKDVTKVPSTWNAGAASIRPAW